MTKKFDTRPKSVAKKRTYKRRRVPVAMLREAERRTAQILADPRFNLEVWEAAGMPAERGFMLRQFIQLPPCEEPVGWRDPNVEDESFWPKKRSGLSILWLRRATDFPQVIG